VIDDAAAHHLQLPGTLVLWYPTTPADTCSSGTAPSVNLGRHNGYFAPANKTSTVTSTPTITLVDLRPTVGCAGKGIVRSSPASAKLFAIARRCTFIPGNRDFFVKTLPRQAAYASGKMGGESRDTQKRKLVMCGEEQIYDDVDTPLGCFTLLLFY
jgi:hypothetical protein